MVDDYDSFAEVYDRLWGGYATDVVEVLDRLVLAGLDTGASVLDLCCGTGQLAAALVTEGYRVQGLDVSEAMIAIARRNAPEAQFWVADARFLRLDDEFDAVVCTYDSVNHFLTVEDVRRVFSGVAGVLAPSGVFVFDVNTVEGFEARWQGSFGIVTDDDVVVAQPRYDVAQRLGELDITAMRRVGAHWDRLDVSFVQRGYPGAVIQEALATAGFDRVEVHDAIDLGMDQPGRSFFVCRTAPR